jgi:hypothetical protein
VLYDKKDRWSRIKFMEELGVKASTEKRGRAEELPWPPHLVMGGRVFYSRRLVTDWLTQNGGGAALSQDEQLVPMSGGTP